MTFTDDDIMEYIKKKEEEKMKKKGKGWTTWEHHIVKQSYMDQREILHMLASCAAGHSDLGGEMMEREVDKFTESFKTTVIDQWKELVCFSILYMFTECLYY